MRRRAVLVTTIDCAVAVVVDEVVAVLEGTGSLRRIALLDTVAVCAVVAGRIARRVDAGVERLVARIGLACDAIVAAGGRAGLTADERIADFDSVAVLPVVAVGVARVVDASGRELIAGVDGAAGTVVAVARRIRLT